MLCSYKIHTQFSILSKRKYFILFPIVFDAFVPIVIWFFSAYFWDIDCNLSQRPLNQLYVTTNFSIHFILFSTISFWTNEKWMCRRNVAPGFFIWKWIFFKSRLNASKFKNISRSKTWNRHRNDKNQFISIERNSNPQQN